jgi:HTH-type transcriptional regulator/antitoxin HigA
MSGRTIPGSEDVEYRSLVMEFPPRPIADDAQLATTEERISGLLALPLRTRAQEDYLDLLTRLVRAWEDEHVEIPPLTGAELVRALCEERGIPQRALVPIFGTASIVSEVLSGKRELQRKHIAGLAAFFHVSPAAFFSPHPAAGRI